MWVLEFSRWMRISKFFVLCIRYNLNIKKQCLELLLILEFIHTG